MQCHATTGLSTATYQKAIDAGIDMLDTAISSMSMTYGHSATETIVSALEGTERDTGLSLEGLEEIAAYFRNVRKKYAKFEGSLKGVDARILLAQVPGGMLTNMESQLKEQGAEDKFDEVLKEIPRVREDLGFIPLVTPTSQIVGTQAVLNVLTGERYKSISKETAGVLKGEYGATAAPVNAELQARVLDGGEPVTCRPADLLKPEMESLTDDLAALAKDKGFLLAEEQVDDVLTYALFPQIGLKFLQNRGNPDAFEPAPGKEPEVATAPVAAAPKAAGQPSSYDVKVDGKVYHVEVADSGTLTSVTPAVSSAPVASAEPAPAASGQTINAPLSGNVFKVLVSPGDVVANGDVVIILEAMKMETEIRSAFDGTVSTILAKEGDSVATGQALIEL